MNFTALLRKYKWAAVLCNSLILSKSITSKMFTEYNGGYGYGWFISGNHDTARHSGDINGFTSESMMNLKKDLNIIVLSTVNNTPADKIVRIYLKSY
jgi:Beta-lactamase